MKWAGFMLLLAPLSALSGCASAKMVGGPDGARGWYSISCRSSQTYCHEMAAKTCPSGYILSDSGGHTTTTMTMGASPAPYARASTSYNGEMLIKCQPGGLRGEAKADEVSAETFLTRKHPKYPEIGATTPEAEATCDHQRGRWTNTGEKVACNLKGDYLFACTMAADGTMRACTHYKLGAELSDEREALTLAYGKPTSVGMSDGGFRAFTWDKPDKTVVLTGYAAGVMVRESKPSAP